MTIKPLDIEFSVVTIGKCIESSKKSYEENHKKNQRVELLSQDAICYLKSGRVLIYSNENDLVTLALDAPLILGLTQMHNPIKYHYLRCDTECTMFIIDNKDATELFDSENLWRQAFDIMTWHFNMYFQRDTMIIHPNIRKIIHEHIKNIWLMPLNNRLKTSVYSFITSRNHISRSAIHKVVQELTDDGKLKIERGKIIFYKED